MFVEALKNRVEQSLHEFQTNNCDFLRFGKQSGYQKIKSYMGHLTGRHRRISSKLIATVEPYFDGLENTWQLLSDDRSRKLLVDLIAYRISGFRHVKLPTNTPEFWLNLKRNCQKIDSSTDRIETGFKHFWLGRTRLEEYGLDVYIRAGAIMSQFFLHQYSLDVDGFQIQVEPGDVAFDCGGCWGETALHFASMCGQEGKVFSFEFVPSNLKIMRRNIELNKTIISRIDIIEQPLWSVAEGKLYYLDNGPASLVKTEPFEGATGSAPMASIDQVVENHSLSRVDFIKMDIEGAETAALKGAETTIRRFRPKLAISLYHSLDDFCRIPAYLDALELGYVFHLHHATIHAEETVLFAHLPKSR